MSDVALQVFVIFYSSCITWFDLKNSDISQENTVESSVVTFTEETHIFHVFVSVHLFVYKQDYRKPIELVSQDVMNGWYPNLSEAKDNYCIYLHLLSFTNGS